MTALVLTPVERAGLAGYLRRLVALDDRAAVRVQARGSVAGVWSGPPFGVLALRPVALLDPIEADATVSAQRLLGALDGEVATGEVTLPDSVLGPPWAAMLPPQAGWELVAEVPCAVLVDQVAVLVEAFRRRAEPIPAGGRTSAALTDVADGLWDGPSLGPLPMRAAHAAAALGLLARDGSATAWRAGGWLRLGCPGGSVLLREDQPTNGPTGLDVLGVFGPDGAGGP